MSNSGEKIELLNADGTIIDAVRYADQGDWAVRQLEPVEREHRGWEWTALHDGGGGSLELINPILPNEYGQNYSAGLVGGGTPGRTNSVDNSEIAPLIIDVEHFPIIPGPSDKVTVTARVIDELSSGISVRLHYRVDSLVFEEENIYPHHNPADYHEVSMFYDGSDSVGLPFTK